MKYLICLLGLLVSSVCLANVIRVPEDYGTIQLGLDNSTSEDTILVRSSINETNNLIIDHSLTILSDNFTNDSQSNPFVSSIEIVNNIYLNVYISGMNVNRLIMDQFLSLGSEIHISNMAIYSYAEAQNVNLDCNKVDTSGYLNFYLNHCISNLSNCQLSGAYNTGRLSVINSNLSINKSELIGNLQNRTLINIDNSNCIISNTTIRDNRASYFDKGSIKVSNNSGLEIENTILYLLGGQPGANDVGVFATSNSWVTLDYSSLIGCAIIAESGSNVVYYPTIVSGHPQLDPNGRLTAGSPCIDAGDPSSPLDPDGTRADIGAYYFCQGEGIHLPDVLRTSSEPGYPEPMTATLQTTCDPVQIDSARTSTGLFTLDSYPSQVAGEFKSGDFQLTFHPSAQGVFTDTLHIWANTDISNTDDPRHHIVPLVGEAGPIPAPVTDLAIQILPDQSAQLTWPPVTQTIYGNPVVPDYYLIFYSEDNPADDHYFYLWSVAGPSFTHPRVARFATQMFYRVVAYKGINPATLGIESGMGWLEVQQRLATEDR